MKNITFLPRLFFLMAITLFAYSCKKDDDDVVVTPDPVANFTFAVDATNPLLVTFTNTSTDATAYSWNFGDNSAASTVASPTYTYTQAGEYDVTLTATRDGKTANTTKKVTVVEAPVEEPDPLMVVDFEDEDTEFTPFGESTFEVVDNPDATGINTSERVGLTVHGDQAWSGLFISLDEDIDRTKYTKLAAKVYFPVAGKMLLKIEHATDNANAFEQLIDVTTPNEWVEVEMDFSAATGGPFSKIVVFPGFDNTDPLTYYFDDIELR